MAIAKPKPVIKEKQASLFDKPVAVAAKKEATAKPVTVKKPVVLKTSSGSSLAI